MADRPRGATVSIQSVGNHIDTVYNTDATGTFDAYLPPADYTLTASIGGHSFGIRKVRVEPSQVAAVAFKHSPPPPVVPSSLIVAGEVRSSTDQPVSGVTVELRSMMGGSPRSTVTDTHGRYQFDTTAAIGDIVSAVRDDTAARVSVSAGHAGHTNMTLKAGLVGEVTGIVQDTAGKPVPGAAVSLFELKGRRGYGISTDTTDASGRYRFKAIFVGSRYSLDVVANNYTGSTLSGLAVQRSVVAEQKPIVLKPRNTTVSGIVVDEDGKPLPSVNLVPSGCEVVTTDSNGRFSFKAPVGKTSLYVNTGNRQGSANVTGGQTGVIVRLQRM